MNNISDLPTGLTWPKFNAIYTRKNPGATDTSAGWKTYKATHGVTKKTSPKKSPPKSPKKSPPKSPKKSPPKKSPELGTTFESLESIAARAIRSASGRQIAKEKTRKNEEEFIRTLGSTPSGFPSNIILARPADDCNGDFMRVKHGSGVEPKTLEKENEFLTLVPNKVITGLGDKNALNTDENNCTDLFSRQWDFYDAKTGSVAFLVDWKQTNLWDKKISPTEFWAQKDKLGIFLLYSKDSNLVNTISEKLYELFGEDIVGTGFEAGASMGKRLGLLMFLDQEKMSNYDKAVVFSMPIELVDKTTMILRERVKSQIEEEKAASKKMLSSPSKKASPGRGKGSPSKAKKSPTKGKGSPQVK